MERHLIGHELAISRSNGRVLVTFDVEGTLDRDVLAASVRTLTEFHPVLLGRLLPEGDSCVVRDGDPRSQRVPIERCAHLEEELHVTPDWRAGPLFRVALSGENPRTTVTLSMPRALADGAASVELYQRLWSIYTALTHGGDVSGRPVGGGLASPPLDARLRDEVTDDDVTAFLSRRAAERATVPRILPARGREPGRFGVARLVLGRTRTERFVARAHLAGLNVHTLLCGVLLAAARTVLPPPAGPVTLTCQSGVDLRRRLTPAVEPGTVQSVASNSTATLEVREAPDPVELGRQVAERLRADLDDRIPQLEVAAIPRLTAETVPRLPTVLVTNLHQVPRAELPEGLRLTGWRLLALMDTPVPIAIVSRFDGRLAIDLPYSRRWYDADTMDGLLAAASAVVDDVVEGRAVVA